MYSRDEIDSALPKAIAVIRLKYNDFDPNEMIEGYSNIPHENSNAMAHYPTDAIPYPLGSIVPSYLEGLLDNWSEVESSVLRVLCRIQLKAWNAQATVSTTAMKNERLLYCFLQEVGRKPQPLLDTIWQEVEEPGSVLSGQAVPAHLLLKAWVIMDFDHEADFEDACRDTELLLILQIRIQEESTLGYRSSDQAFMDYAEDHYPVQCTQCEATVWIRRCLELYDLETQLDSRVYEDEQDGYNVA